jgi:hypothetical protein
MTPTLKYIVYPDWVWSESDQDWHFISFRKLIELHRVRLCECVDASRPEHLLALDTSKLIPLGVSESGSYPAIRLP